MTYEQWLADVMKRIERERGSQRFGQFLFNQLAHVRPDLSSRITGSTADPFFVLDKERGETAGKKRIKAFFDFLEANW